ncbi:MAG: Gfo/Idh/MocA family oxidoreductase [Armatimonadota bacterium]
MPSPEKLTACVVGGGAGGQLSLKALAASDRFDLLAAADLRAEVRDALEAQYPGLQMFPDHEAMFAACPTDVVCVSTYPPSHELVTLSALQTLPDLKGLLVEKPLGHTAASGRRILEAIRERGLPLAVPHGLLTRRTPMEIIDRVQKGDIGDLKLVEIQCRGWDIINAGIHWLDFFVTLSGNEPMEHVLGIADASTRTFRDSMQVETMAVMYAQTRSGIRVVMNTGDEVLVNEAGKVTLFRLVGTAGLIEFYGWENGYRIMNAEFPETSLQKPEEFPITGHHRHLENMADQAEQKRPDYSVAEASLLALEICEGAYLSSRHRARVTFPVDQWLPPQDDNDWQPGQPYNGVGGGRDGRQFG